MAAPTGRSDPPSDGRDGVAGPAWPAAAGWRVVTDEGDGIEAVSTALASRHRAVDFARDLLDAGLRVLRIEGPDGTTLPADVVAALCAALRRAPDRRWPGLGGRGTRAG